MAGDWTIIEGCAGHEDDIAAMIRASFAKAYGSGDGEAKLVADLRADGDVVAELTALDGARVVGHVMFSRLSVEPVRLKVAALAPVTARIDRQGSGIGSSLVREGLALCTTRGFDAVAVLGDPAYYGRFGFSVEKARALQSDFSGEHFQALELKPRALSGGPWRITYPRAFGSF